MREAGKVPPASLIAAVGQMIGAMTEADVFRDGAGLRPSSLAFVMVREGDASQQGELVFAENWLQGLKGR